MHLLRRYSLFAVVAIAASSVVNSTSGGETIKDKQINIVAQAPVNLMKGDDRKGSQKVIRSEEDLATIGGAEALKRVTETLKVDSFDMKKHMLVAIDAGVRNTGGYKVTVENAVVKDGKLTITYKVIAPDGPATQALTRPGAVAVLERFSGPVEFAQIDEKAGRPKRGE